MEDSIPLISITTQILNSTLVTESSQSKRKTATRSMVLALQHLLLHLRTSLNQFKSQGKPLYIKNRHLLAIKVQQERTQPIILNKR